MTPKLISVILQEMADGEANLHLIQLLVNYWETRPSAMAERLDRLIRSGITHLATFVPWQAVESDISHALRRFLQTASDRKMTVSLILTPEVGVHYPNSGLPKDLVARKDDVAKDCDGNALAIHLPPNGFALPSLFAPELSKRYASFLTRMDSFLGDLGRTQPELLDNVTVILSGSFWKYYRSPKYSSQGAFNGPAGDYSGNAALAFRQRLEQFFSQREFVDPGPMAANRWKSRDLDEVNRRWFYQHSEDVFRNRTFQLLRRKAPFIKIQELEIFTPEADPGFAYSHFLQMVSGGHADMARLSSLIDEAATRGSVASTTVSSPFIHWSSLGGFRTLADSEKQFLILKSLLLMGGQGGGVLLDESDWLSLSHTFRARAEGIARLIAHGDLNLQNRALYLAPHLWSSGGKLWNELLRQLGPRVRMVSSLEYVLREPNAKLLVVDPDTVMTRDSVLKLTAWAKSGRIVVLPQSSLYTESARREIESLIAGTRRIEINLGIPYYLHSVSDGSLIVYDMPKKIETAALHHFISGMLALAEIENICRLSDGRISVIPLDKRNGGTGLFVLNETRRHVVADIIFPTSVAVSDLAAAFTPSGSNESKSVPSLSSRFNLEVAPCGILPLAVSTEKPATSGINSPVREKTEGLWT